MKITIPADEVRKLMSKAIGMYENYIDEEQSKNFDKHFEDIEVEVKLKK